MNEKYVIALYLRLSLEDDGFSESESIANQRGLLNHYIKSCDEFAGCKVLEFMDDGYTGTNFNRPAVTDMLNQVKDGKINCVVVKDFSRFGRNHIEVGDYIEQIFPFLGVRFISVNNNFDSKNHNMQAGTLDIAFTNLIYDYYSKDISKKVTSAKQAKMRKGDYMSSTAFYGYRKMPSNKNRLEIDPVAAEYVRKVFALCLEGKSTGTIARELNSQNIPTPLVYKRSIGYNRKWNIVNSTNHWTRAMVLKLLREERYIGITISGKTKAGKVGSKQNVKQLRSEWIAVHNTHEPIVANEVFDKAQQILGLPSERMAFMAKEHLFSGKLICGHCNHIMRGRYDKERPYFFCETVKVRKSKCATEKIYEDTLGEIVLASVVKYAEIALCADNILQQRKSNADERIIKIADDISSLRTEIEKVKSTKVALYENYKEGTLTKDMYLDERSRSDNSITKMESEIVKMESEIEAIQDEANSNNFVDCFKKHLHIDALTPQLVSELVSAIKIYDNDSIEIIWNFEDDFQRVLQLFMAEQRVSA